MDTTMTKLILTFILLFGSTHINAVTLVNCDTFTQNLVLLEREVEHQQELVDWLQSEYDNAHQLPQAAYNELAARIIEEMNSLDELKDRYMFWVGRFTTDCKNKPTSNATPRKFIPRNVG